MNGLNSRLKVYKYSPNQHFRPHYDGIFMDTQTGEESRCTFLVYLNEDYVGGETQFHVHGDRIKIQPKEGTALIFFHHLRHEGLPLLKGEKYVLRSDIMYKKSDKI